VSMLGWHGARPHGGALASFRDHAVSLDPRASWEEHRLQHLPIAVLLGYRCRRLPEVRAFLDHALSDVCDSFPHTPGSLVPMEVGLRIVSLCLTADLSMAAGIGGHFLNGNGMRELLAKHLIAVRDHWEWRPRVRGNHYLANVTGLIWGALYLGIGSDDIAPLCDELFSEGIRQILPDGGSFEGTTSYLRLSLELLATTLLLLQHVRTQGEDQERQLPRIPDLLIERLQSAREFLRALEVRSGSLLQVGDCDSGRCGALMLEPTMAQYELGRDRATAVEALATRECLDLLSGVLGMARYDERVLSLRDLMPEPEGFVPLKRSAPRPFVAKQLEPRHAPDQIIIHRIPVHLGQAEVRSGHMWLFEQFGLWVFRCPSLLVALRVNATGDGITNGWHSHTDLLSMQMVHHGHPLLADAGTFIYLGDRDARELFRSSTAHNSPCWPADESQITLGGPFRWISSVHANATLVEHDRCSAIMKGPYGTVGRKVLISDNSVEVTDRLWRSKRGHSLSLVGSLRPVMPFSPAYGEIR
jgi:hypothetical protein